MPKPTYTLRFYLLPLMVFLIFSLLTILITYYIFLQQQQTNHNRLDSLANEQIAYMRELSARDLTYIDSAKTFMSVTDPKDWEKFETLSRRLINSTDSLISLQWMQKVTPEQLPNHVEKGKQRYANYMAYTLPTGQPRHDGYIFEDGRPIYIATYVYPLDNNKSVLGFYDSRDRFYDIVEQITDSKKVYLSAGIRIIQDGSDNAIKKDAMLVYYPVFDQEDKQLVGITVGVIRLSNYFQYLMNKLNGEALRLTDLGLTERNDPLLYQSDNWQPDSNEQYTIISKELRFHNRHWKIEIQAKASTTPITDQYMLITIIVIGLFISALLAIVTLFMVRNKYLLEHMLNKRTLELQHLVNHDSLTSLANRRYFNIELINQLNENKSFTLISFDIDKFKLINDTYGHLEGDALLKHISHLVSQYLTTDDKIFRMGGDEFTIITPIIEPNALETHLNDIRKAVEQSVLQLKEIELRCTISIGAAIWNNESIEAIQKKSDEALYQSKKNGRNLVTILY